MIILQSRNGGQMDWTTMNHFKDTCKTYHDENLETCDNRFHAKAGNEIRNDLQLRSMRLAQIKRNVQMAYRVVICAVFAEEYRALIRER